MTSLESLYTGEPAEAQHLLNNFWTMITDEIKNVHPVSSSLFCWVKILCGMRNTMFDVVMEVVLLARVLRCMMRRRISSPGNDMRFRQRQTYDMVVPSSPNANCNPKGRNI